jgi:hypothetical protein
MADYSMSRSNYLKLMYGKVNQEINSLTNNTINAVGDTSYQSAEIFAIQQNNQNAIDNAQKYLNENSMHTDRDRNGWQRFWDAIGETTNDIFEGLANFADDIYDFGLYAGAELDLVDKDYAFELAQADWQAQFVKATNVINPAFYLNGDAFTKDFWTGWDSTSARAQIQRTADSSLWNELGEDGHRFVKNLGQGIGYMVPTLVAGVLTGGASTGVQTLATLGTTAVGAFTGGTNDAYEESGDFVKSMGAGATQAVIEVGSELLVGKALGALGAGTGKIAGAFGKGTSQNADNFVKMMAKTMFEEGVEEGFSAFMQPVVEFTYKGKEAFKTENGKIIYFDKDFWWGKEGVAEQALIGATMGGILGGANAMIVGSDVMATANLLKENKSLYNDLSKYEKGSAKYNEILEQISKNTAKIAYYVDKVFKGKNSRYKNNMAKLLSDPLSLKKALETKNVKEVNKLINNRIKELANPHKVGTRNLFNELQSRFNTDYELEFGNANGQNAYVDRKNKKIVINENISDEYAGVLAHEYLGHAIVDGSIDQATRQKIFDSVVKSDWFKKYNKKLRENYIEKDKNYQSLETPEQKKLYWQSEVINNYLEDLFKKGNTAKSVKMINDVFLRNTLLNRMQAFFNKKNNLNLIKNNAFLSEFTKSVKTILDSTNKNVSRALDRFVKGETLNKTEENYYKKYKAIFDNAKLAYSKNIKNTTSLDINKKYSKSLDSNGNTLTLEQTEFFKDSKVRDENGNLLVVYHGSFENFNVFDKSFSRTENYFGKGFYFTTSAKDVKENYLNPSSGKNDVNVKIEDMAYDMYVEAGYNYEDLEHNGEAIDFYNECYDKAIEYYSKNGKMFIAYLNMTNPLYVKKGKVSQYVLVDSKGSSYDMNNNTIRWLSKQQIYDGIIDNTVSEKFPNVEKGTTHYIVFKSNQIKLTSNLNPTSSEDIRYSKRLDSDGQELSIEQAKYFENSKIRDDKGNLLVVYHGTRQGGFTIFDSSKKGYHDKNVVFFTDSLDVAKSYAGNGEVLTNSKLNGLENLNKIKKEIYNEFYNIKTVDKLVDFINNKFEYVLNNYYRKNTYKQEAKIQDGDVILTTFDETKEIYSKKIAKEKFVEWYKAIYENYIEALKENNNYSVYPSYLNIENPLVVDCNGQNWYDIKISKNDINDINIYNLSKGKLTTDGLVDEVQRKYSQYDGIILKNVVDGGIEKSNVYVTLKSPNQIKSVDNTNPTPNDDIRYSKSLDSEGNTLTEAQEKHYENSKIRDENGALKVMYHGTQRMDRVGNKFDPARATSGPMAYFTDNKEIATNYSTDKKDTSIAYEEEYDSYNGWFRLKGNEKVTIDKVWYKLSYKQKQEIIEKAKHISFDDQGENIIYDPKTKNGAGNFDIELRENGNNALSALVGEWLNSGNLFNEEHRFMEVLKFIGIDNMFEYRSPYEIKSGVYEVYLNVTNPFDTSKLTKEFVDKIKDISPNVDDSNSTLLSGADMWDKNNPININRFKEKLAEDFEKGTSLAWTSIPDYVSDYLKAEGYDGIVDTGGKYREAHGGKLHTVVIPFYPNQIKNINNLNPTESDDIRYSNRLDSEENPLTEAQERYFKDSKFVDEEGNLLILYHGSDNAGFMTFDNEAGIHFFTPDYEIASTYTSTYNLVNTKKFNSADELIDWWYEEGAKELGREDIDILPKSEALEEINEYLDILKKKGIEAKKLYDLYKKRYDKCDYVELNSDYNNPIPYTEKELIEDFIPDLQYHKNSEETYEEAMGYHSDDYERNTNNIYKVYVNATNPLIINCRGRNFTNIIFRGKSMQTDEIAKIVKEEGKYDGIIFKNVVDNGGRDFFNELGMSDVYVAFDSKQIKAVDNYNPTNNNDIRYSKKLDVAKIEKSSYNEIKQEEVSDEFRKLQEECRKLSEEVSFSERSKSLDDSIYGRIKRVLSRQIGLYNSRNSNSTRLLKNTNNFEIYENIDGDLFHDCFEIARTYLLNGELVDLHDNYNDSTCYLSKDGLSGFAITKNGDLISVFNLSKEKGFLRAIAPVIKSKAKTLDCFISSKQNLQGMYEAKFGFKTASVMDHNMEYDHDDIAKNHNNPKVAFMVNTDKPVETRNFDKDSYDQAQAYQQSFIQNHQVATLSTPVDNTTTKVEDLTPYETNKAQAIKEGAQEKLGKTINLKNTQDVYNTIESGLQELFGEDFKIDNKKLKARRLFEEYNIAKNSAKKQNCRKFVVDILAQEVFDNVTYREYLQANGVNVESKISEGTELMYELLNARAVDSNVTKKINKLNKWIDLYKEARAEQAETFKFMKTLNSIRNNLSKRVAKFGNTGQLDTTSGMKALFYSYFSKFSYTRANYLSLTNLANLQKMINDGSFKNLINSILNPYKEVINMSILQAQADTIIEMAEELANSQTTGQKHLSYEQIVAFNNLNKTVYHLYKEYTSGVLEATREQALKLQGRAKEVSRRKSTNKAKSKLKKAVLDAMSPKEIIAEMVGGTHTEEFNLIYNDLYRKPYERQIDKYVDFLKERDKCIKNIQKEMNKKVKVGNLTVRKYVLFQFYLNTLSPDNLTRMKNSNLTYTEDGITKRISFNDLEVAMNKYINPAEKADLDNLFKLYNTSVKKYVEKISEKNLGFKTSRDNYYPIVASEVAKNQDLSNPNKVRYNINAMNNGRLKKLSNKNTIIEININPIHLFDSYIESMTITGEIGLESQKLNRLFQLKDNNGNSFSSIVNEYVPHAKDIYIPSIFNKLIGNTQTIQRSSLLDKMVGKFSTATLGLNIRSMLKQIGSFFTAWEKVGIGTGFKVMLNPKAIKRIFKNRAYLKANNPVFKLRTHENGYVRGATLSAGATQFGSKVMQTITNASLKGIEAMDRLTCYATFTLCEEYVKKTHGYEIGSDENLKLANEMFSEMILETQSNSDRISMSRVRSGEKGAIVKNLFGLFQSDAQNKAGLLFNIRNDIRNINKDIIDVEAKIKNTTDPEAKKKLEDNRNILIRARTQAYTRMRAYATGLLLSGIAVALADKLADYIYDKEDPKDTELSEVLMAILGNTTIDWIPYLNQIANWWQYDGVEISALEMVNDLLETIKGFTDGEVSSQDFMQAIIQLATVCGLPLNNLNKLVQGTISNFDPEAGIKYKSLFYNMSQSYLGRETNSYIENGNIDKARASLSLNFSLYKFEADDELTKELVSFKQNGINISIKNTPTEITDAEGKVHVFTEEEMSKFRNIYSGVNVEFKKMKADNIYQKLSMEEKAKAVKKLADLYFDKAKGEATSKLAMLVSKNIPVYSYILIMTQLQEIKGKDNFIKEINKIRTLNKKEKLLLMSLMGYSVSELSKPTLLRYLRELGLSSKEIEKWGEK